jgi:signal transduction histidine kinase/CheY-like chemotaxis protein
MLGLVYYRQEKYGQALQYFLQSRDELSHCPWSHANFIDIQQRLNAIGICYTRLGAPDSGLHYFRATLDYLALHEDSFPTVMFHKDFVEIARGVVYGNMGDAFLLQKDTAQAEQHYLRSISINSRKNNDLRDAQLTRIKLANLYVAGQRFSEAQNTIARFEKDYPVTEPDQELAKKWHHLLWQYYDRTGQTAKAYTYLQSYLLLRDSPIQGRQISDLDIAREYEHLQHEYDLQLLKNKDALKTNYLIGALCFAVMSIIIALLIGRNWSRSRRNEQELLKAKNMAEEAARAKQQFLSNMSHEIRTPLNAIIGMTYLLLQENPAPGQKLNLDTLKFSGENLLAIINDILDYSKIEAGKIAFENIDFSLRQLIHNVELTHQLNAKEKGLALLVVMDPSVPDRVTGDPVRLAQVLNNLLSNAVKFTHAGMVKLQVASAPEHLNESTVTFRVQDTGIGIRQEQRELIFESFTQATTDTSRNFGGTGLGLAITKRLLELQGSSIRLESEPGKGSVFSFDLNFKLAPDSSPVAQHVADGSVADFEPLPGYKVLVVDDSEINLMVARKFLDKWGLSVDYSNSGEEAIQRFTHRAYDIVLMDLQMPGLDGYETSRRIRSLPAQHRQVPIIALSADVMMETRERVIEEGMDDFISKPFDPNELYGKMVKHLGRT